MLVVSTALMLAIAMQCNIMSYGVRMCRRQLVNEGSEHLIELQL